MKAFLLAAGLGTRIAKLTKKTPKCLLPIGGKPLIEIWFKLLEFHGITEVLLNTHWLSHKVEDYILKRKSLNNKSNLSVTLFHENNLLGSAGTVLSNKKWVEGGESFFILFADNLTNVNLTKMRHYHDSHKKEMTIGVFESESPEKCGIVEISKDKTVKAFIEKPKIPSTNLAAAGVYLTDKRIFKYFPDAIDNKKTLDLGFHILPKLANKMKAYLLKEILIDIGTPDSYRKAKEVYSDMNKEFID